MSLNGEMTVIKNCIKDDFGILSDIHGVPGGVVLVIKDRLVNKLFLLTLRTIDSRVAVPREEDLMTFDDFLERSGY